MRVYCAKCGKLVADITGYIRRGTVFMCRHCWRGEEMPEFLRNLFRK